MPQFSILKMMLWMTILAGGLAVVKASSSNSMFAFFEATFNLILYTLVVCGILSVIQLPKSFACWFPTGMNLFFSWVIVIDNFEGLTFFSLDFYSFLCLAGFPYGVMLLVLQVQRIKRGEPFILSLFVYQLASWVFWTGTSLVISSRPWTV